MMSNSSPSRTRPCMVKTADFFRASVSDRRHLCVGSGESHMAYFYRKIAPKAKGSHVNGDESASTVVLPARAPTEKAIKMKCDPMFANAVDVILGDPSAHLQLCSDFVSAHLAEGRSQRIRKPRVLTF